MTDRIMAWSALASAGVHALSLAVVSPFVGAPTPPPELVPIEIATIPTPPPPPAAEKPREPKPVKAKTPPRLTPPRIVQRDEPKAARIVEPPRLLPADAPAFEPRAPMKDVAIPRLPETALVPSVVTGAPAPVDGGESGAGRLFSTGDIGVLPGRGAAGGTGAAGSSGFGPAPGGPSAQTPVIGRADRASAGGPPTVFARPLGGYQTRPRYPESALRQRIEGVALLRFEIQATGAVGQIFVDRSAGHPDLDVAAIEAVKTWKFAPARRGDEPVSVWVTLPVRFELRAP